MALGRMAAFVAVAISAWAVAPAAQVRGEPSLMQKHADRLQEKITIIRLNGLVEAAKPRLTPITTDEVNAYLSVHAAGHIPAGVMDPQIEIVGDGRLAGRAVVDLDVVRRSRPRGWLDPASYLAGRLPVAATGVLYSKDGVGRLEIEAAEIGGVPVPQRVLQELVTYYSRTQDNPDGIDLEAPFRLPARIQEVRVSKGEAIVVQ